MIDFSKLIDPWYWFRPGPGDLSEPFLIFFAIFFGFFVVLKILLRVMGRQYIVGMHKAQKQVLYKIEYMLLTMGLLGLLWTLFRYELVPYFSARYWVIIWMVGLVIWGYLIFYYAQYQVPQIVKRDETRKAQKKYF
ncbi:MAG: hypothetical protein AAB855_03875 [Patescibacteria group bacterium]